VKRALLLATALALTGCDHTSPFTVTDPEPLGPAGEGLPRRLTFNPGPDESPAALADTLIYTTLPFGRVDRDRCLGYLPPDGGTLLGVRCPGGELPDGWQDALLRPAPSSDGRLALVREQAAIGSVAPSSRTLQISPLGMPDSVLFEKNVFFTLPDGQRVLDLRELAWSGGVVRFVGGEDSLTRDPGSGIYDTLFTPLALATIDPAVGEYAMIPGTEGALAHVNAPGGGIWFVSTQNPRVLLAIPEGGAIVDSVGAFSIGIAGLSTVDGLPIGYVSAADSVVVQWLDPRSGAPAGQLVVRGVAHAIAGVPGTRRFVLDLERGTARDLWLFEVP